MENTSDKLHNYYNELEIVFTPEMYVLFIINMSKEVV